MKAAFPRSPRNSGEPPQVRLLLMGMDAVIFRLLDNVPIILAPLLIRSETKDFFAGSSAAFSRRGPYGEISGKSSGVKPRAYPAHRSSCPSLCFALCGTCIRNHNHNQIRRRPYPSRNTRTAPHFCCLHLRVLSNFLQRSTSPGNHFRRPTRASEYDGFYG